MHDSVPASFGEVHPTLMQKFLGLLSGTDDAQVHLIVGAIVQVGRNCVRDDLRSGIASEEVDGDPGH